VKSTGVIDPAWPAAGVRITFQSNAEPIWNVLPDGAGGAFVLWQIEGVPRGTHVLAAGQIDPALPVSGDAPLLDAQAQYISGWPLVACAGKNGGLIFVWPDARLAPQAALRARWLTSSLAPDASEPATPRLILTDAGSDNTVRGALPDGAGGLYVTWG